MSWTALSSRQAVAPLMGYLRYDIDEGEASKAAFQRAFSYFIPHPSSFPLLPLVPNRFPVYHLLLCPSALNW
jgi:hypothetical protein